MYKKKKVVLCVLFNVNEVPDKRKVIRIYRELMMMYHPNKAPADASAEDRQRRQEATQIINKKKEILDQYLENM